MRERHRLSLSNQYRGRWSSWSRDEPAATFRAAPIIGALPLPGIRVLTAPTRLVSIVGVLSLMARFLLFRKFLPGILDLVGLETPLLADNLRYVRIRKARVPGHDLGLAVLPIENES